MAAASSSDQHPAAASSRDDQHPAAAPYTLMADVDTAAQAQSVLCIECNWRSHMRCLLCLDCFDDWARAASDRVVTGTTISGQQMRPIGGIQLKGGQPVWHFFCLQHWEVFDGKHWKISEWKPKSVLYQSLNGNAIAAGLHDPIGLFGSHVTLLPYPAVSSSIEEKACPNLDDVETPSTPRSVQSGA